MPQPVIALADMKTRIRAIVLAGRSLEREAIKEAVFADGRYSYSNEKTFDHALDAMLKDGELTAHGRFGPFQRAKKPPVGTSSRTRIPDRLRSASR